MKTEQKIWITLAAAGCVGALLAVIAMSLLVSGCTDNTKNTAGTDDTLADVKLQIAGSTTVLPVAEECARVFMENHPGSLSVVSGGGSSHGVKAVADGTVDIGTASRDLKSTEKDAHPDLVAHGVAKDGVAVTVHPSNPVTDLTMEQLQGIYTGTITNWKDVGGTDSEIMVVTREEGSGIGDRVELARQAVIIEQHYSSQHGNDQPMDIEWAKDGVSGDIYIVQARPETVKSRSSRNVLERYELNEPDKQKNILVTGCAGFIGSNFIIKIIKN